MIRRITAIGAGLTLLAIAAQADEPMGGEIIVMEEEATMVEPEPVSAPPPPFIEVKTTAIAAGIGTRWGGGTLVFEGQPHEFSMTGISVGDLGFARSEATGWVSNLERVEDLAGTYVAVEAGAAAGTGASALTMRNEKGVTISLRTDVKGVQLKLGAEGVRVELR